MKTEKPDWKAKLRAVVARGDLLIGAGAGTGLSAKCAEEGGAAEGETHDVVPVPHAGK